jgi:hypothetical protein
MACNFSGKRRPKVAVVQPSLDIKGKVEERIKPPFKM